MQSIIKSKRNKQKMIHINKVFLILHLKFMSLIKKLSLIKQKKYH